MWLIGGSLTKTHTRAGSRPDALRLSQPISRLPLESRITLETEVLAESKVGDSTAMTQSIWVYVTVAFAHLESGYAKWLSSYFCRTFPRPTLKEDKSIIAAQLSKISIKRGVKLHIYCNSSVTFVWGFTFTFSLFSCICKYLECPLKDQVAPLIVKDYILAPYIIFYVIKSTLLRQ